MVTKRRINYFVTFDKQTLLFIKIGILVAILSMLTCTIAVANYSRIKGELETEESKARVKYQEALIEHLGQPQIIEQRYYSPMEEEK